MNSRGFDLDTFLDICAFSEVWRWHWGVMASICCYSTSSGDRTVCCPSTKESFFVMSKSDPDRMCCTLSKRNHLNYILFQSLPQSQTHSHTETQFSKQSCSKLISMSHGRNLETKLPLLWHCLWSLSECKMV